MSTNDLSPRDKNTWERGLKALGRKKVLLLTDQGEEIVDRLKVKSKIKPESDLYAARSWRKSPSDCAC